MAAESISNGAAVAAPGKAKLHGRAFYESIGSPKYIVAPMVDQSEFAWRVLSRSFLPESQRPQLLAYTPMLHARIFAESQKYRDVHFPATREPITEESSAEASGRAPYLDGNPALDRPLFVQFCANEPAFLLRAAKMVAPYCDAVDLNLGCPQGIARKGHYGAFLQEDQELIFKLINTLHENLDIPVTAKIRILDTKEATLKYAQTVLKAGASILTVHGRRREQKGHLTGLADWQMIRYLRDNLPPDTVMFANGNILQHDDLAACLEATGADAVMSAEGNLSIPGIFAPPPPEGEEGREYWRGKDGRGGWRADAVMRRYLDILHRYAVGQEPPQRRPLFMPGDDEGWITAVEETLEPALEADDEPPRKKQKQDGTKLSGKQAKKEARKEAKENKEGGRQRDKNPSANFSAVQPHLFHMLRHLVARHHDVRDLLARARSSDMAAHEAVLARVEYRIARGLLEYARTDGQSVEEPVSEEQAAREADPTSSARTVRECKRPWWVVQPIIRPLPHEALAKGAVQPRKVKGGAVGAEDEAASAAASRTLTPGTPAQGSTPQTEARAEDLDRETSFPDSKLVSG